MVKVPAFVLYEANGLDWYSLNAFDRLQARSKAWNQGWERVEDRSLA